MFRALCLAVLVIAAWAEPARADPRADQATCDSGTAPPDKAIAACTRNIQSGFFKDRELGVVYYNRGNANLRAGHWDAALADYGEAIGLRPDDALAFNNRAFALSKMGRFERAISDYSRALYLKPDHANAFVGRGAAREKKTDIAWTIADDNQASVLDAPHLPVKAPKAAVVEEALGTDAAAKAAEDLAQARRQLKAKEGELNDLLARQKTEKDASAKLRAQLKASQSGLTKLKSGLTAKDRLVAGLKAQVKKRDAEIAGLKKQIAKHDGAVAALEAQLTEKEAELGGLREKAAASDGTITGLKAELNEAVGRINDQGKTYSALYRKFGKYRKETERTRLMAKRRNEEIAELELHRMILGGAVIFALGLAVFGFVRNRG